jgi:hypothetical protein
MTEYSFSLLFGVACGVLAAYALFVAGRLWTSGVLPLLRRWRYRGVNISGEWKGLGTGNAPAAGEWTEIALSLKQDARAVRGRMTIRQRGARSFDLDLQVAGSVSDGYLSLALTPASKAIPALATALLKVEDGPALNGQLLYRNAFDGSVDAMNLSVHRSASIAAARLQAAREQAPVLPGLQPAASLGAAAAGR